MQYQNWEIIYVNKSAKKYKDKYKNTNIAALISI